MHREKEKRKKEKGGKGRGGECAPSSGMHCPCFCGSSWVARDVLCAKASFRHSWMPLVTDFCGRSLVLFADFVRDAPGNARAIRATIIFSKEEGEGMRFILNPPSFLPSFLCFFLSFSPPSPNFDRRSARTTPAGTNIDADVNRFFSTQKNRRRMEPVLLCPAGPRWAGKRWQRGRTKCYSWTFAVRRKNRVSFKRFRFVSKGWDTRSLSPWLFQLVDSTSTSFPLVIRDILPGELYFFNDR